MPPKSSVVPTVTATSAVILHCPVRGPLSASALAKDGLTASEESHRVDFLRFLVEDRAYPEANIAVETVVVKNLGAGGKNKLRADVIVYDEPAGDLASLPSAERLARAVLVAEIKRDTASKKSGVAHQLEPALMVLPRLDVMGIYWDAESQVLLTKSVQGKGAASHVSIKTDTIANLPNFGDAYREKPITVDTLTRPSRVVGTLFGLANIMRSHGVNDEVTRYRETVKLLLARYIDEREAKASESKRLGLQVLEGADTRFRTRVDALYKKAATRYNRARTLFVPKAESELSDEILRDLVRSIQGFDFSSVSSDTMQQVFMSFVPVVFKKKLDQYFTPVSLIDTMVEMVAPGPTDMIVDPAMGTGDFLTSAMSYRRERGDTDAHGRVFGADSDSKAFDLAVINMILNHDGQANLRNEDSIKNYGMWAEEMDVVFCNPPFGSRTLEKRPEVLTHYDLGHRWEYDDAKVAWLRTDEVAESQQVGILFIEKCWKMLNVGGRMAIILPEGYLATAAYGYVRRWLLDHFIIRSIVELPRRIFARSGADLRSNVLIAVKKDPDKQSAADYPIHASMVRRVGYKLGGDYGVTPLRDPETGTEIRDDKNELVLDSHFHRVLEEYAATPKRKTASWEGATLNDIESRRDLDMKPRRLVPAALRNIRSLSAKKAIRLGDVAEVMRVTVDLLEDIGSAELRRIVEGQYIRAIEGIVVPQFPEKCWSIAERKQRNVFSLLPGDVIVGLVRPERRNVGMLLDDGDDVVGSPDGLAVVRPKSDRAAEYPAEWLFAALRAEPSRLQLWTEAGGTSYGKLNADQIEEILLDPSDLATRKAIADDVKTWVKSVRGMLGTWDTIGTFADRRPILNSPLTGLFDSDSESGDDD
jgi:type I restriction enzyme M protein